MTINNLNDFLNEPKKECRDCREIKPLDQFRVHAGNKDGYDIYCKACRKVQYSNMVIDKSKRPPIRRNRYLDLLDRSKKHNFIFYMEQRPYYFESIFKLEATEANIQNVAKDLNLLIKGDYHDRK